MRVVSNCIFVIGTRPQPAIAVAVVISDARTLIRMVWVRMLATPGEVLVSQTVRDLVAGSGLAFEDRGFHRLKGVPDEWHLFRAALN